MLLADGFEALALVFDRSQRSGDGLHRFACGRILAIQDLGGKSCEWQVEGRHKARRQCEGNGLRATAGPLCGARACA